MFLKSPMLVLRVLLQPRQEISRRHEVFDRVLKVFLTMTVAVGIVIALPGLGQGGQAPAAQPAQKNWKDRAEYDLYNAIVKEQDASKRLALLNSWKEKYPTSD